MINKTIKYSRSFIRQHWPLLALAITAVLVRGYTYRGTFMLPYSYQYLDPTLFSRDIAFFPYDLNFFFLANAYLSKIFSYETIFFVGYLISSLLLVAGIYMLSSELFKDRKTSYLAVILTIFAKPALSAMTTVWTYYYYRDLAMGLILISLALFLRKKFAASFSLLGVSSLLHILFSLYVALYYGLYLLINWFREPWPVRRKMLLGMAILAVFISAPIYLILSSEQPTSSPQQFSEWISIIKVRSFDHFFPSTWLTNSLIMFSPLLGLFLIFFYLLWRKKRDNGQLAEFLESDLPARKHRLEITLLVAVISFLGTMAIIFSEIFPVRMIIITQLFRPTIFLTFFSLMFGSYLIVSLYNSVISSLKSERVENRLTLAGWMVLASLLFISLFKYDFRLLLLCLPLLILSMFKGELVNWWGVIRYKAIYVSTITISLAVGGLGLWSLVKPDFLFVSFASQQIFRFENLSYILFVIVTIAIMAAHLSLKYRGAIRNVRLISTLYPLFILCALLIGTVNAVNESTIHSDDPCYTAQSRFDWAEHFQYPSFPITEHMKMALWAKDNTSEDSLFMIPPECGSDFRNFARRSVLVDFKYGTMSTFSVDFAIRWWERVGDVSPQSAGKNYHTFYRNLISDYSTLSEERVVEIVQKYDIDYAVFENPSNMSFPVVYKNSGYVVFDVGNFSAR